MCKTCDNCAHHGCKSYEHPCDTCEFINPTGWEPQKTTEQNLLFADLDEIIDGADNNVLTNADHIRGMTDEELADLLDAFSSCSRCRKNGNDCFPIGNTLDWLQ